MDVRCPFCFHSFHAEDHPLKLRECPTCLRHYEPSSPDQVRCPTCEANWAEYVERGGQDPRAAILERDAAAEVVLGDAIRQVEAIGTEDMSEVDPESDPGPVPGESDPSPA